MNVFQRLIACCTLVLVTLSPCTALLIQQPNGAYTVALSTATLVDSGRIDPYDPAHGKRNVTLSLFYPVHKEECYQTCTIPYMPPATAAYYNSLISAFNISGNNTFESFKLQVCCKPSPRATRNATTFPLILFSAGLGGSRLIYNVLAQTLASKGYAVATLDSTYGSVLVEYPDGTYVSGLNISYWCTEDPPGFCKPTANIPPLLETGVRDAQFVLETLGANSSSGTFPIPGAVRGFDVDRVVYGGHSFGGATALRASMEDARVVGAFNLDGSQFGNITDVVAPAMLFGRSDPFPHNRTDDATWQETWTHLKGWRREVGLEGAQHTTFGDMGLLAEVAGWSGAEGLERLIGKVGGRRSFEVVMEYTVAFVEYALRKGDGGLFDGPSEAYPEIIVNQGT